MYLSGVVADLEATLVFDTLTAFVALHEESTSRVRVRVSVRDLDG